MKKFIGLMVVLMTIVTLSVSAQTCPTAVEKPIIYGDFTPCRNQKNVTYTIANRNPALAMQWTWCRGQVGQNVSAGFVPTEYRWTLPSMTTATDGITTVNSSSGGYLYTTQTTIAVSYKTRGGYLSCYYKDSCGVWQEMNGRTINLTCDAGTGEFPYVAPAVIDTGRTVINADVIHGTYEMSFDLDSISGETGPYTNLVMYVKCPTCSCSSNFAVWFSDGWYQQIRQTPDPTLPFTVAYGWSLYFASPSTPPRTFRIGGTSASGGFMSLPFTISTSVPSTVNYPTLP